MDSCRLSKYNEVYATVNASSSLLKELSEYFTFQVPGYQFMPAYRNKLWDGKIRLLDTRTNKIYYGLHDYIKKFCDDREYELTYDDDFFTYNNDFSVEKCNQFIESINLSVKPRPYQIDAVVNCITKTRSLLLSPTASGKSLIIYLLTRYLNKRTLIIVPTISLTQQLYSDFKAYDKTWNVEDRCHIISQGREKESDKQIVISTWQSIYKLPSRYFSEFDVVIGDEAHLFKSKSLTTIMSKLENCSYRFGTTGTLDDLQTHKLVLEGLFGTVYNVISTKELIDANYLSKFKINAIVLKYNDDDCNSVKGKTYQQEMDFIVNHQKRNKFICNLTLDQKGNTLLLFQYVDKHGKMLYDMISNRVSEDRKVFFVYGGTDGETRENIRKITETQTNAIIIASFGTFSTGINITNLHNIIFASPSKSKIRNLQSIGRGLRKGNNKQIATLYDIADDFKIKSYSNYTINHFKERIQQYSEQEFDYSIFTINI